MKRRRSPQEKKSLSYARDRRNTYGEHSKGSRKSIPLRKRIRARARRRAEDGALRRDSKLADRDQMAAIVKHKPTASRWQKFPDEPLGSVLNRRKLRRSAHRTGENKQFSAQSQDCVLCLGPASFSWAESGNRKRFFCLRCAEYQITVTAEKRLAAAPAEWRETFLKKVRSLKGNPVLVITVPSSPRPKGAAHAKLLGELVPSAMLPPRD